jgi:hypothetical protein
MGTRILGSPGSRRRRRFLLIPLLAMCAMASLYVTGAQAVHDTGAFELDGNATNDSSVLGDDWDNVCHQVVGSDCSTTSDTNGATAVSWVSEPNRTTSIFTGGGSKDPQDISNWAWKDAGGLPDKDNLQHSFAARYSLTPDTTPPTLCPAGTAATCDVLFFGSDRFDNSGDAQQGFWFFQNKVDLGNVPKGGGFNFTGLHENGDLLIISDFSNGGTTSTISVYRWNSAVSGNLELLQTSTNANCATVGGGDQFCGIVNPGPDHTAAPWSFTDKSGNHDYINGEFYEGGVNLSTLGLSGECFSSVASETRSSTSTTATLKDFVLGQFAVCAPNMTTQASATVANPVTPGSAVHDTATITVTGATNPADPTGDVEFFLCGPIASGDCSTGGTDIGAGTLADSSNPANTHDGIAAAQSPDVNTAANPLASGRYCFRAEWPGDSNYSGTSFTNDTDECFAVKDTSATTTAQNWLPNDTASVTLGSGGTAGGTVVFSLYESADCTGTAVATFSDSTAPFASNNTSVYTTAKTISWRAVFTPTNTTAVTGSTSRCETTVVTTVNNDSGP